MKRHLLSATAAGVLSFAPSVIPGAFAFIAPDAPADTLPELEVASRKVARDVTSATPFHSLDAERMLHTGVTDFADALKRLPGVNLRDYGGAGGLKTVSVRGLGAQHTAVTYDGIPLSDVRSGEIDLSRYRLDNVSALSLTAGDPEEIFVPARTAASAATLAIITTKAPSLADRGIELTAQMRAGGFGLWNPYLQGGWNDGERFSIGGTLEFLHADNDYPFTLHNGSATTRLKRENSMMNSTHGELNFEWRHDAASSLQGKIYAYDNLRRLPGPVIIYLQDSKERLHDRNWFGQLRWRRKLSSKVSLALFGKFNWSASAYSDEGGQYPGGFLDQRYFQREAYASAALLYLPCEGLALDYSADWIFNNLNSNLPTDTHPYRNAILQSATARYSIWRLTATARLLHSLYLDRAKEGDGRADASRFSPSVSVSLRALEDREWYLRASYKNIFRTPSFNELYFDHYGTLSLKPEVTDQWNIGSTFSFSPAPWTGDITLTADGYINMVSNKIVAIPFNLFKWTMTNLGKVRIFGADITLNSEFIITGRQRLLLTASYSYQRAQVRSSRDMLDWMKQVAYTPLNSGAASLSWLNPWVSVALHADATSARYTTNTNLPSTRIAGYVDAGVTLFHTFTFRKHALEIRGDITNILDKEYSVVARYPMPGRNWTISVKFDL